MSRQSVSKWESGQSLPEIDKLIVLSDLFDITLDDLLRNKSTEIDTSINLEENYENNSKGDIDKRSYENNNEKNFIKKFTIIKANI